MLLCEPQVVAFSAGLLAHAQRALAVATTDNTRNAEKQLQCWSLQVSHVIIPAVVYLHLLQHSGEHRVIVVVAYLSLLWRSGNL